MRNVAVEPVRVSGLGDAWPCSPARGTSLTDRHGQILRVRVCDEQECHRPQTIVPQFPGFMPALAVRSSGSPLARDVAHGPAGSRPQSRCVAPGTGQTDEAIGSPCPTGTTCQINSAGVGRYAGLCPDADYPAISPAPPTGRASAGMRARWSTCSRLNPDKAGRFAGSPNHMRPTTHTS